MPNTRVIRRADGWPRCAGVTHIMKHPLGLCCLYEWHEETKKKSLRGGKLIKSCQVVQVKFLRCSWLMNDHPFVPSPAGLRLSIFPCPCVFHLSFRSSKHENNTEIWSEKRKSKAGRTKRMNDISRRFDDDCRSKWHWKYLNKDLLIVDNVNCSRVWELNAEEDNFFNATRSLSPSLTLRRLLIYRFRFEFCHWKCSVGETRGSSRKKGINLISWYDKLIWLSFDMEERDFYIKS